MNDKQHLKKRYENNNNNNTNCVVVKALCYKPEGRGFETR
jgi:hypothetical protein